MDILVHGTKGGRQIFTPKKLGGLIDVNSDASKASAVGQEAFAIRFVEKAIIFSKYKIIRDVRGDKRTGFLGFSLFLPNNTRLNGIDIISILDKASDEYCKKYIPENDNNLKDVKEEWAFLDRIQDEYKIKLLTVSVEDIEILVSGIKDDAFIYYENDEKLQKYFDAPCQDEYRQYRQVLFVKEELKEKPENPLNALRHSDDNLTAKIDLENPTYKLIFNEKTKDRVRINVKVNDLTRSNHSKFRRKDKLEISWSKLYCDTVNKRGSCSEIGNEFLEVNPSSRTVTIKDISLNAQTKRVTFNIKDWKGNPVDDAKIICKSDIFEKNIENNNQISLEGEDLGKRWIVSANNNRLLSENRLINFEEEFPGDTATIDIILNKHELKITVHEGSKDGDIIKSYKINKTEFIDNEIEKSHTIFVESRDFESYSFDYNPLESEIDKHVFLKRKQVVNTLKTLHSYDVSAGMHGTFKNGNSYISNDKNGKDVIGQIIPNKGYKFIRFELQSGTLVAQYGKKNKFYKTPEFIIGTIVGGIIIFMCIGIWMFFNEKKEDHFEQPQLNDYQYIKAYIKGNSLILDTLTSYKKAIGKGPTEIINSLDSAIKKRQFINNWNFDSIKTIQYYPAQQKFDSAIKKIESSLYETVKNRLSDVSELTLNQIVDTINTILTLKKKITENKSDRNDDDLIEKKVEKEDSKGKIKKTETQPASPEQKKEEKIVTLPANSNATIDIKEELQSGSVSKKELQNWKDSGMDKYKKSINLYLQFWDLVLSGNNQFDHFEKLLKDVKKDPVLLNSELMIFLYDISKNSKSFGNTYQDNIIKVRKNANLTLRKLKEQLN